LLVGFPKVFPDRLGGKEGGPDEYDIDDNDFKHVQQDKFSNIPLESDRPSDKCSVQYQGWNITARLSDVFWQVFTKMRPE
jgi:hypothetical protein